MTILKKYEPYSVYVCVCVCCPAATADRVSHCENVCRVLQENNKNCERFYTEVKDCIIYNYTEKRKYNSGAKVIYGNNSVRTQIMITGKLLLWSSVPLRSLAHRKRNQGRSNVQLIFVL